MIELIIEQDTTIDENLEDHFADYAGRWAWKLRSLDYVKDARFVHRDIGFIAGYTVVTFETEEDKTLFLLRWS